MTFDNQSVILKLVSGETIICQVISDTDKNMLIRDPFEIKVHSQETSEGIRSMTYYADWFLSSKSRIHMIRKEHVMSAGIPDDDCKSEYSKIIDRRNENPQKHSDAPKAAQSEDWTGLNFKPDNDITGRN